MTRELNKISDFESVIEIINLVKLNNIINLLASRSMGRFYIALFIILTYICQGSVSAQINNNKYQKAEEFIEDGNFHKALEMYQDMLEEFPNNANLNFKIGFCYLSTATQKSSAIPYLEFASKNIVENYSATNHKEEGAPIEALFYLGKAYQVNYRFDNAERTYFELKKKLSTDEEAFLKSIDYELAACQYARLLMKMPVEMTVSNLGRQINSEYTEHSPVISGDESVLIYTSKRIGNTGGLKTDDGQYFEDIFISYSDGKKFGDAKRISTNINTAGHEASIGLSFDGSTLFIYRDDNENGNIYVSTKEGNVWGVPEPLPATVNSKYRETHASMSFDKSEIYFTSDRKGGFGGLDIYRVRKLPNGNWSRAQNLGPSINTPFDEEGPYLHPDGTSLFFASKGHNTMGGFDIFVSYINEEEDKWLKPENIGYPINTPEDDIYYVPSVDGRRAYYASYTNNSLGYYDIFRIDLSEQHVRNQTVIAGIAKVATGELLVDGIVSIFSMDDELVGIYSPDVEKKKFLSILPRGKTFKVLFESSNFESFEKIIKVPEFAYDQSGMVVQFEEIVIGGNDPSDINTEVVVSNEFSTDDEFADDSIGLFANENEINAVMGNSKLAESDLKEAAYNSSDEYSLMDQSESNRLNSETVGESDVVYSDFESDGTIVGTEENKEDILDKAKETKIESKKRSWTKSKLAGDQEGKDSNSNLFYYLIGLLVVVLVGFMLIKRK